MPVSILIVDDQHAFRRALRRLLELDERFVVLGEARDGEEGVSLAARLRPDVVLMDVSMPGTGGIEATRRIVLRAPGIHVIGLSLHDDHGHAAALRAAGARGLVSKGGDIEAVWGAILAWAGTAPLGPGASGARAHGRDAAGDGG